MPQPQPITSLYAVENLLVDQYQCTEEYCNATTALHNTILSQQQTSISTLALPQQNQFKNITSTTEIDRSTKLLQSIDRYQQSLTNIQNVIGRIEQLVSDLERIKHVESTTSASSPFVRLQNLPILQDHLQRTYRILRTIYTFGEGTQYYHNGIMPPKPTRQKNVNIKLVALGTLRASIQIVKESLPPSNLNDSN